MTPELATDMSCGRSMVLYSCVSFCLLAQESRDISQAETKITLVKKAEQVHKMTPIFTQNDDF